MTALLLAKEERRLICHAQRSWKVGCERTGKNRKTEGKFNGRSLERQQTSEAITIFTDSGLTSRLSVLGRDSPLRTTSSKAGQGAPQTAGEATRQSPAFQ